MYLSKLIDFFENMQWNYFDDCTVTEKKIPGFGGSASGDFSSAYILFYQRAGNYLSSL